MGPNNKFSLELGYSIGLKRGNNFTVIDKINHPTNEGFRLLNLIEPGGIMLGINFYFGVFDTGYLGTVLCKKALSLKSSQKVKAK